MRDGLAVAGLGFRQRVRQGLWAAGLATAGLGLAAALAWEDRRGERTLAPLSPLVDGALAAGRAVAETAGDHRLALGAALLISAGVVCAVLVRTCATRPRCILSVALALLSAAMLLLWAGHLAWAGLAAVGAGVGLVTALPSERLGGDPALPWLTLPLLAGALLRFFALAEVPTGYAQHSVVHHFLITLPLKEKLAAAWAAGDVATWLRTVSDTLLNEQFGADALVSSFGFSFMGVGMTPSRLTCAMLGTLTIAVAWRVGSLARGRRLALIFAFVLALSPWHVSISRYGDAEHVLSPLQFLLVLAFFLEARATGSLLSMVGGGAFLATGWLVYSSNQVTPLIVFFLVVVSAILEPDRFRRDAWRWATGASVFVLLSWAPIAAFVHGGHLLPNLRMGYLSEGPKLWSADKRITILAGIGRELFVNGSDPWFSQHGGSLGLLEATLLVPGLLLALASLRRGACREASRIVVVALPLTLLPGLLAPDVSFRRVFLFATVALFLASLVLARIVDGLAASGLTSPAIRSAGAVGAILFFVLSAHVYFRKVHVEAEVNSRLQEAVASRVRRSLGETYVVVALFPGQSPNEYDAFIRFAAYEELRKLRAAGAGGEALWGFWPCSEPGAAPVFPKYATKRCLLVPQELVADPARCSGPAIPERASEWLPGATPLVTADRGGEPLFRTWCVSGPFP